MKDSGSSSKMTTLSCRWPILGFDKNDMLSKSFFWGTDNGNPKLFSWYSVIRICSNIFFLAKFLKGRILHVCFLVITHVFTKRGHSAEHIYKRSTILCMESFFFFQLTHYRFLNFSQGILKI